MIRALAAAAMSLVILAPSQALAWTRSYVVSWYEPAMYYGGTGGPLDPGTDCPTGANKEINWVQVLVDAGYSPAQAEWLRDPANPTRDPVHGQNQMAFRGKDRANVYIHPTSTPEVGLPQVQGKIAEGFDLDGDPRTGFVSPTGKRGVDNSYYRAFGCWKDFRGRPRSATSAVGANDTMKDGGWTVLIVVSGQGRDPMNDPTVSVGIYDSRDKVVKDPDSEVMADYSFRINPHRQLETILAGRTVKGRILVEDAPEAWIRAAGNPRGGLQLLKVKVDLQMLPNGELQGMIGGYTPWQPMYDAYVRARGPIVEILGWVRLPDLYYALKRNADYSPAGPGGEKTHISYALRVFAKPAFVMTPDGREQAQQVVSYKAVAPAPDPPREVEFSRRRIVVDGIVIPRGTRAESLPEDMLLPPAPQKLAQAGSSPP